MPSDKRKPLTEAMEKARANPTTETGKMRLQLEAKLTEIGHLWIGQSVDNCEDQRDENMRRFKLFRSLQNTVNLTLWYGKSENVPCNDLRFPDPEDATYVFNAVDEKLIGITIFIREEKDAVKSEISIFSVHIGDDYGLLPAGYDKFRKGYNHLDDVQSVLEDIRSALS